MKIRVLIINKKTFQVVQYDTCTSITISSQRWAIKTSSITYYACADYDCVVLGVTAV